VSREYLANELDAKLASSTFATFSDVRRFVGWFEIPDAIVSEWDKHRYAEAKELLRLQEELRKLIDQHQGAVKK
jgi:hypothetical protein